MLRRIPVADGTELTISSDVSCVATRNGYFLSSDSKSLFAEFDFEMCISSKSANSILAHKLARSANELIFNRADLAKAIFAWDASEEIDNLAAFFADYKQLRGLDVACGYGRLLLPLTARGFTIDGVDVSKELVEAMALEIPGESGSRAMVCDVSAFSSPGAYGFAYAAMNSLRFLETKFALKRHFHNMKDNLLPGSPYAFCITINAQPGQKYKRKWSFEFENEMFEIHWIQHGYCHLKEQITELIEIHRTADGAVTHSEFQTQGDYSFGLISNLLDEGGWKIKGIYDLQFNQRTVDETSTGSFWFLVTRAEL
jgi:SAM-dependent methyltransferase